MTSNDLFVDAHWIWVPKRWLADQHFVHQDAECPPVDGCAVALVAYDLGCEVLGRPAQGVCDSLAMSARSHTASFAGRAPCWRWRQKFCEAKVDQFQMSIRVKEDIFRLQIAISDVGMVVEVG